MQLKRISNCPLIWYHEEMITVVVILSLVATCGSLPYAWEQTSKYGEEMHICYHKRSLNLCQQ